MLGSNPRSHPQPQPPLESEGASGPISLRYQGSTASSCLPRPAPQPVHVPLGGAKAQGNSVRLGLPGCLGFKRMGGSVLGNRGPVWPYREAREGDGTVSPSPVWTYLAYKVYSVCLSRKAKWPQSGPQQPQTPIYQMRSLRLCERVKGSQDRAEARARSTAPSPHHSRNRGLAQEGACEEGAASRKGDPGSGYCRGTRLAPGPTTRTASGLTSPPAPAEGAQGGVEVGTRAKQRR